MNWLPQEEIKRRAEIGDEEALNVSIEEWEMKYEALEKEKPLADQFGSEGGRCGLCWRYQKDRNSHTDNRCPNCFLYEPRRACCQLWRNFRDNKSLSNAQAMLNRLYLERGKRYGKEPKKECKKEPKKEIRHLNYGYNENGRPRVSVKFQGAEQYHDGAESGIWESLTHSRWEEKGIVLGNLLDDLARNSEDLEEFTIDVIGGATLIARITDNNRIELKSGFGYATATLDEATEIAQGILQEVATAKRKAQKKDC